MKYTYKIVLFSFVALFLFACSGVNEKSPSIDPTTGKHPAGWAAAGTGGLHPAAYLAGPGSCSECHGNNLTGGISNVSCFSASRSGISCHPNGPASVAHVVPYISHSTTARASFSYCLGCHQIALNGAKPPGCQNCHLLNPQTNPINCLSCHASPPNGAGYPNIAGSHSRHNSLNVAANVTATAQCDQCHLGLGLGTLDHINRSRLRASVAQANQLVFGTLAKSQLTNATSCATSWCHGGNVMLIPQNNPPRTAPVWGVPFPVASLLGTGGPAGTSGSGYCAQCHGYPPLSAAHTGVTAAQCNGCHAHLNADGLTFNNAALHIDGQIQSPGGHIFPYPGASHAVAGATISNCNGCHNTLDPGVYPVAAGTPPNCRACHISSLGIGCSDCHGTPPNAAVTPNRNFAHSVHMFPNVTCSSCHNGAGSGTAQHGYGPITVAISATYQAKTGAAATMNAVAKTCSSVSCHGGQASPAWPAGIINVDTQCAVCHQLGATQFNSYNSGFHNAHVNNFGLACTVCHNVTTLAVNHFTRLETSVMEGPAAASIGGGTTTVTSYNSVTRSCTPNNAGGGCHGSRIW